MHRPWIIALTIPALAALGCPPAEQPPQEPAQVQAEAAAPSDAEIAHIVVTANTIDIEMGELALARSQNAQVREFAQRMIGEHRAANDAAQALAGRLGVTPADNDVSRSLRDDAAQTRTRLEALSGAELDRAYIAHEVSYHQAVLQAIDQTLLPSAQNEELRSLITEVRPIIAAHLEHAQRAQGALGG